MHTRRRLAILIAAAAVFTPVIAASSATAASCTSAACNVYICNLECLARTGGQGWCQNGLCACF
jgi:hypothetical protein